MNQGRRQNDAVTDRSVDWYFADKRFADFFTDEFAKAGYSKITVHYREAIKKKFEDCTALVKNHMDAWRQIHIQMLALSRSPMHVEGVES